MPSVKVVDMTGKESAKSASPRSCSELRSLNPFSMPRSEHICSIRDRAHSPLLPVQR